MARGPTTIVVMVEPEAMFVMCLSFMMKLFIVYRGKVRHFWSESYCFLVLFFVLFLKKTLFYNNMRVHTTILRTHTTRTRCGELPVRAHLATCRARARVDACARTLHNNYYNIERKAPASRNKPVDIVKNCAK